MAKELDFKVSYMKISEGDTEKHNNVLLNSISLKERKEIKSLIFLPINTENALNIIGVLKGFSSLENLYLPSSMTVSMKEALKVCPMLKSVILLTPENLNNSLSRNVVKVTAFEQDGENSTEFKGFVTNFKDGKQMLEINSNHIQNKPIILSTESVERLNPKYIHNYVYGDGGLMQILKGIDEGIVLDENKLNISDKQLENLLLNFVEKGVTFEEFTIDFSKLYDKIKSYKTIITNVNQDNLKDEIEDEIVKAYQNVLNRHYENLLKNLSSNVNKLCKAISAGTQEDLLKDLFTLIIDVVVTSPKFPVKDYNVDSINSLLDYMPESVSTYVKSSKDRENVSKYLTLAVESLKSNTEFLSNATKERISNKVSFDYALKTLEENFDNKQVNQIKDAYVEALISKNFETLTKNDLMGIVTRIKNELKNGEVQGGELSNLIKNTIDDYPTENEIKNVVVDFIAEKGYEAIKVTKA